MYRLSVDMFSIFLHLYLKMELLGHLVTPSLTFEELPASFANWPHSFILPPVLSKFQFFCILTNTSIVILIIAILCIFGTKKNLLLIPYYWFFKIHSSNLWLLMGWHLWSCFCLCRSWVFFCCWKLGNLCDTATVKIRSSQLPGAWSLSFLLPFV